MDTSVPNLKDEIIVHDHIPSKSIFAIENEQPDLEKMVRETRLYRELRIAYKWMSFAGLLYSPNTTEIVNQRKPMKQKMYIAYQWFVDALLVINALRFFTHYPHLQDMTNYLVTFVYHIFMILMAALACSRSYLEKNMRLFIIKISCHKINNRDESSINRMAKFTKFYVYFVCIFSLLYNIGFDLIAPPFYPENIVSQSYPQTESIFFYLNLLFFGIASILGSLRIYVILAHCFAMCHFLTLEYFHLAQTIRSRITEIEYDDGHFLEAHRAKFEVLNGLLNHINRINTVPLMMIIFFCIFEICLMIYGFHHSMNVIDYYSISVSAGFGALFTVFLIGAGIILFSSAHQLTDDLYAIDLRNLSSEASLKVSIFLTRLTGSPIGISVAGLFVIDHSTILMLAGTLLTYIIVVIQTKTQDCQCQNKNNITTFGV